MWTNEKALLNKKPNFEKLGEYGFARQDDFYIFSTDIMGDMFRLNVYVTESGKTQLEVIDKATNEEYTLIKTSGAVGSFVGSVRAECEDILNDIVSSCFEPNVFKSEYAKLIIQYIKNKYGSVAEYLWEKFPNNAVFREEKTGKWYAALLTVEKRKIGIDEDGTTEIIDLKETPDKVGALVDGKTYLAGYHMNKKHWYTIVLDGSVPIEEIYSRIDKSYNTLKKYFYHPSHTEKAKDCK